MKKANHTPFASVLIAALVMLCGFVAGAQSVPADLKSDSNAVSKNKGLLEVAIKAKRGKLPNIQQVSLRAPAKVKIDGKATEWNDFMAYNHQADVFYSIANDDDNLYLVVKAVEPDVINRIMGGGLTFTIQKSLKKTDKNGESVTFPAYQINKGEIGLSFYGPNFNGKPIDTAAKEVKAMQHNRNLQLGHLCHWIRVTGIAGIDTLISVYNEESVIATGTFDIKAAYTFELSVSLKQLSLSTEDEATFAYHIKLNGASPFGPDTAPPYNGPPILRMRSIMETVAAMSRASAMPAVGGGSNGMLQSAPTDFWAEYTLAKK